MDAERAWGHPGSRKAVRLNYHKFTTLGVDRQRAANITAAFGWDINTRLCVYQCGFGWILMGFWENGIQMIQGIENSPYIQANLTINEDVDLTSAIEAVGLNTSTGDGLTLFNAFRDGGNPRALQPTRIHDTNITRNNEMNQLRSLLGGPGCEVLTFGEFVLNRLTDQEAIDLSDNLGRLQPSRIIHFINPLWTEAELPGGGTVALNAKSGEEWKTILPDDTFIELQGYRVVE
jgi:hypothetical protein